MRKMYLIMILISISIIISRCVQEEKTETDIISACQQLCQQEKDKGIDLSYGPCLSNQIAEDWVCDIAHSPRTDIDNQPENQCPAFGETASHFVELDENCELIRKY